MDNLHFTISSTISDEVLWDELAGTNSYLKSKFLHFVVKNPPSSIVCRFVTIYNGNKPIGIAYFQIKDLNLGASMRVDRDQTKWYDIIGNGRKWILKRINHKILICGNTLVTGENAFSFSINISNEECDSIIDSAINQVIQSEKGNGKAIGSVLVKDFYSSENRRSIYFGHPCYTGFEVQPNMQLRLDPDWKTFDDYLASMKAKSRTRIKKALKCATGLQFRLLDTEEIALYKDQIYALYKSTSENASFNLFLLHQNYFENFQKSYDKDFEIFGVFDEDGMIAFYTTFHAEEELDAHFLGYDRSKNAKYKLYLNILLKLVEKSIYDRIEILCLSRTAMEIKSSIGAEGHDMRIYLKSTNRFINFLLGKTLHYFLPKTEWTPRSPFKA